ETEAARLRDALAAAEAATHAGAAAPAPAPAPADPVPAVPAGVEERLDMLQEVLADKEARIAYLADRVARLESNLGGGRRQAPAEPPAPSEAPSATPPADPAPAAEQEPDDLTEIWGIGPAIQRKLNSIGVTRFEQVAALGPHDRERVGELLGDFLDRIDADDWVGQARRLVEARGGTVPEQARLEPIRLAPGRADDLTRIKGIGPFIASTLRDLGVTTFAQIAAWTPSDVEEYGEALVIFQGRITREDWVGQARSLLQHG
ncbi:MAG: hypothetical protein KQH83_11530, partial [Actinobacteria bacterium]|nr:hypothetical protein [Actinomycetota bacterium]